MKTYIKYLAVAAALLSLAACNKFPGGPREITITAAIGPETKVTTTGSKSAFDTGDKISVYAWTGSSTEVPVTRVVDGVANTFGADGKWAPATQMLWADAVSAHYFLSLWPATTVTDFSAMPYTLNPSDQKASDLLVATNLTGLKSSESSVQLTFDHMMAKLAVNLQFKNQWDGTPTVASVTASAKQTATVALLTKAVTATGDAAQVALAKQSDTAWSGLQVPQAGFRTVSITIDGQVYVYTHGADIPLASGKVTTLNLLLGRDRISLSSEITIDNWTSGGDPVGGDIFDPAS